MNSIFPIQMNLEHADADTSASPVDSDDDSSVDPADALFQRGDMMRKLRQLEMEDEAARREADESHDGEDASPDEETLDYQAYLAHQSYYDDYKHVNYRQIDFGPIRQGQEHLIVKQDRRYGKGGFVWDPAFILSEHVINEHENLPGLAGKKRIIELGAGTGACGLILAKAFPTSLHVDMTDLPEIMPLLEENSAAVPNTSCFALKWGEPVKPNNVMESSKYDVVMGADVVASIYDPTALLNTIDDLSHRDTWVYLAVKDRLADTIEPFERNMRKIFAHVERHSANSVHRSPAVWIMVAHGKRTNQ